MKYILVIISLSILLISQPNYQEFSGTQGTAYAQAISYEETVYLHPDKPGKLKKLYIFLAGVQNRVDTLRVIGDPSDGYLPGTWWVSGYLKYNTYAEFIINYQGDQTWYELDVSNLNLDIGGLNRVGLQHIIKEGGPFFLQDGNLDHNASYLNNVFTPNPNFYNIAGTMLQYSAGDFFIQAEIEWEEDKAEPQLVDVTEQMGLLNEDQTKITANNATIVDINKDGFDDIVLRGKFFINDSGNGFIDRSEDYSDITGTNLIFADLDNDGFLDAYSGTGNANDKIFWGNENGFTEQTSEDLKLDRPTDSPLFFDYDLDGDLDIFIAYRRRTVNGSEVYFKKELFENKGNREFVNVSDITAIGSEQATEMDTYGANVIDIDNNGRPDIFVATYRLAPDLMFMNFDGYFLNVASTTKLEGNPTASAGYFGHGMGSDWGDYNNDGLMDLAVGNLGHPDSRGAASNPSLVFRNAEDNIFTEVHKQLGIKFFEMNSGVTWVDLNNDGYLDLWHNQYSYEKLNESANNYSRVYINGGPEQSFRFEDRTYQLGALIHGSWTAQRIDFDNDGDQDLLVCSAQENVKLFENRIEDQGSFIKIRLDGSNEENLNNNAYGSTVKITTDKGTFTKQLMGTQNTGRYSQSSDELIFGLGDATEISTIELRFANGIKRAITNVPLNTALNVSAEPTSVNYDLSDDLLLYPNPAKNNLIVSGIDGIINNIKIIDSRGYQIYNISFSQSSTELNIDLPELSNGKYYLEMSSGNTKYMKEFTVVR